MDTQVMKAQLAKLKKDLEKKKRKLKNCESLARARDHVRQKILEHAQLDDSSSEPGPRLTRVKFGGREEFVVPVEGQSEGSLCSDNSHNTRHDTRQQAPSHDTRSDMRQQSPSDTSQRAPSSTSHCTSSDGQHTTRKACQYTSKDTTNCASQFTTSNASQQGPSNTSQCTSNGSQHTKNNTNQHATNNTSQSATNDASQHTSDISQQALSHTSQSVTSISSRHVPSNVATCRSRTKQADTISRPEERAKSLSDDRRDACTLQSSSVVSHDPVDIIGESQRHADDQSKKDVNGIPKCSAGSSHVTHDVSDAVVNSGGVDISTAQTVPIYSCTNKELALDRMPNNQELSVENLETVDRRTVLLKSVDVSSGYRAHDVDSNEFNESCAEYSVLSKEDGILSADVNSAPTTCGQKDTLAANIDHTIVRNKSEFGYCRSSQGPCIAGESSFDVETSSPSQPLIALIVNKSQSGTVVCGANSSDSNLNASGVPTVSLRKVRKRKSVGHHNDSGIRRRSSRLRSMSSNETSCPLSSGTDTQDMLLNSKVGTTPADTLSSSSRHALRTGSPSLSQSSVEASHGKRARGAKRGRKSRKVETSSSHEYNTRFVFRRNPCSQESFESTFNSSSQCSRNSSSLMPDVGLLLSSPSMVKDVVYFSLPDDEYGSLKLQIAKRKALRQSNGSPRDLATKTDNQVSDRAPSKNSQLESEKANLCSEMKDIAVVKSDIIIEQQDSVDLLDARLGMKSCDHQGIVENAQEGALVASKGPFLLSDNSPVMSHSLEGARDCRNVPPKTRSRSQDENVAKRINVRKNKSSRQRKKNACSFVQTTAGSSQEDIFQSEDSCGGNRVQTRRNISRKSVSRDASVDLDTVSKDGQLDGGVVPRMAVVSTNATTAEETCDSISHTKAAITCVAASVYNVQHQMESSLSSGTSPSRRGHEIVSTMHAEEDELPHPSIASSCTMHRNMAAVDPAVGTCSPPGDSADLDANKNTASLFSENCPLKLVRSFETDMDEEIMSIDTGNGVKGDMIVYCTRRQVVLCKLSSDKRYRQMTLAHSDHGSTFQQVHLLASKKAIAVLALVLSGCGDIHGELYKVTGRGVTAYPLTLINRLTCHPSGAVLSCVLADLHLCVAAVTKDVTSLVTIGLTGRLDGDFTETRLDPVTEALVSLGPIGNLHEAVVGASSTTVHVWNYTSGSLLVSVSLPLKIDNCPMVSSEEGLLLCSVVCYDRPEVSLVVMNPSSLRAVIIDRAITPVSLQHQRSLAAVANSETVCTLSANNSVALWSIYSATCLGYRPAVDATRVRFNDASKTLLLASNHTVDIYSF